MFQQFYDTGTIPQAWRDTLVSQVHKKESKLDPGTYRPVYLISILCKLQEHIIISSMLTHLKDHVILYQDQHEFPKRLSTETHLIQAVHDWASTIYAKGQTNVLFLDFSKAFAPQTTADETTTLPYWWPATGLLLCCVAVDKEWLSMELARPGHQCSQASPREQWSDPYFSSSTSITSPATSTHECDSLLTTTSFTRKSAALPTTGSCKMTSPNSNPGPKDCGWHSSKKSATFSRSPASVTSANSCTTSKT